MVFIIIVHDNSYMRLNLYIHSEQLVYGILHNRSDPHEKRKRNTDELKNKMESSMHEQNFMQKVINME